MFLGSVYLSSAIHPGFLTSTLGIFVGFYFLVKKHDFIKAETAQLNYKKRFFENELSTLQGQQSAYYDGKDFTENAHPYTEDLDVFGPFSLFSLLNRGATSLGINSLRDALLLKTSKKTEHTQEAVKEIKTKQHWNEEFLSALFPLIETDKSKTQAIYNFTFDEDIKNKKLLVFYGRIIPFLWIGIFVVGYLFGWVLASSLGFLMLIINLAIVGKYKKISESYFTKIEGIFRTLQPIERGIELILVEEWESLKINTLRAKIPTFEQSNNPIKAFGYLIKKLEIRRNQMATMFYYIYSPFDVIQLVKLKHWYEKNPAFFKNILTVIGEFEVLSSFAICAFNNPDWAFPELTEKQLFEFSSKQVGHPLLKGANIRNDFDIQQQNRISLVTGSNMSGKSTFLRSIGTNILLAYIGAAVCAKSMRLSKGIELITYMRIKDDLNLNVSTFKAEINRVKMIVNGINQGGNHLFLIDEMLRGTNSEDKLKGAIALLRKIALSKTYAIVATHDLRATVVSSEYADVIKNFFFEFKNVNDDDLEFDYKIKAGVCQSFNASQLLKQVGLPID